jgi:ABC-type glycerol-3-phosphate transport system substrate-binding protein
MKNTRWLAVTAATALLALAACSSSGKGGGSATASADPTKVSGDITVLTNRTDLVTDGTLKKYAAQFNLVYPNVKVTFQGLTDYEGETKIRMNTSNYGDVLLIPSALPKSEYPEFFAPLGSSTDLTAKYRFIDNGTVNGQVYGIAQNGNANGFVYNKKVWAAAGVTTWPTTSDEFIADLQAIKAKTQATPYYTNYHDGWPLTKFEDAVGSVSCDPNAVDNLATDTAPWAAGKELNSIDTTLYTMVNDKLTESDPTTTDWNSSKNLIGTGKVATMWLGSWAVSQMQAAATSGGASADDIGFMPWPAQTAGKFCSVVGPDYLQGISIHSAHKDAARAWLNWFTDQSTYAQDQGDVPTLKSAPLPASLKPYQDAGVQFIELSQAKAATVNNIDKASQIGLQSPDYRQHIVDLARGAAKGTLDAEFASLNKAWSDAVATAGS